MNPFDWEYRPMEMTSAEVMSIFHVKDWPETLMGWGDWLFDDPRRRKTWLAKRMLEIGTTPAPIIVAVNSGSFVHPREHYKMVAPYQLVEGHMRLAYLHSMIRRGYEGTQPKHAVVLVAIPHVFSQD